MMPPSIYSYIKSEESRFETDEVQVGQNWNWNFKTHVQMIFHLMNGVFFTGANNFLRAFKNIMEPMLNLCAWMEDIELKDVLFYVEGEKSRVLSFLIKKYHDEVYVKETNLDQMFDDITESDLIYGGVLMQKVSGEKPELLELRTIAFCDQTDALGGPIAFKHYFSPSKLRKMSKLGWGEESNGATASIEELIILSDSQKEPAGMINQKKNTVTGKSIEVYILRGALPSHYLNEDDDMETYFDQVQICAFYTKKDNTKEGIVLYRKKDDGENIKFFTSKEIYGRALGRGVGEALLTPQIWTNFLTIHKMNLLEAASKVLPYTDDPAFATRNKITDMENLEMSTIEEGRTVGLIPTAAPTNITLYERSINEFYEHAQLVSDSFDPVQGKEAVSGTTFRGQERLVAQGSGNHKRRRGKRAKFIEEIYRDWIIPDIIKKVLGGKEFFATLSVGELEWVTEQVSETVANKTQLEAILSGEIPGDKEILKQQAREQFSKKGNRHLLEILEDEFRDKAVTIGISVASKQKDIAALSDKFMSIFQTALTNPQGFSMAMQNPALARTFNDILEFSGLSQADFTELTKQISQPQQVALPQTPIQQPQVPQLV